MDNKHCEGCRDDFYNDKNPLGVKRCWMLDDAKIVLRKRVHIDQRPPWNQEPEELPNCYNAARYVFVAPERTC